MAPMNGMMMSPTSESTISCERGTDNNGNRQVEDVAFHGEIAEFF